MADGVRRHARRVLRSSELHDHFRDVIRRGRDSGELSGLWRHMHCGHVALPDEWWSDVGAVCWCGAKPVRGDCRGLLGHADGDGVLGRWHVEVLGSDEPGASCVFCVCVQCQSVVRVNAEMRSVVITGLMWSFLCVSG